jgi:putative glycosyltransferase (TIGR04372 family)
VNKNILNKFIKLIHILICLPLILAIILICPFIKIKIFEIETRAIGHFARPIDIFLSEIEAGIHPKKRTLYICFPNKRIANNFLLKKWKEKLIIVPRIFLEPIFLFFKRVPFGFLFLAKYRHWRENNSWKKPWQAIDLYNVLDENKKNLTFSPREKVEGNKTLKKNGIDIDNYIGLIIRSPIYYFENKISPLKKNLRDSDLKNFTLASQYLSKKNYKILNFGHKDLSQKDDNIIMYNNSDDKNDFNDIFLPYNCSFMISSGLGLDNIITFNRRKRFHINYSEIHTFWIVDEDVELMIPKKFQNLNTGKFIPYSEVLSLGLSKFQYLEDLNKNGYDCVSNTSEEILGAVKEIEYFYRKKKYLNDDMDFYNEKFRKIYFNHCGYKIKKTKICNSFLKLNKDLIN